VTLFVNGAEEPLDGSTSVADLVDRLGCGARGVAVAVNDDIVPRSCWSEHPLHEGDRVEVLRVAQGG
jgi:sulfur carrier protein